MHEDVSRRCVDLADFRCSGNVPAPEETLRHLLKGRDVYQGHSSGANLAPYKEKMVSLPESVHDSPLCTDVAPEDVRYFLEDPKERILRAEDAALEEALDSINPF